MDVVDLAVADAVRHVTVRLHWSIGIFRLPLGVSRNGQRFLINGRADSAELDPGHRRDQLAGGIGEVVGRLSGKRQHRSYHIAMDCPASLDCGRYLVTGLDPTRHLADCALEPLANTGLSSVPPI